MSRIIVPGKNGVLEAAGLITLDAAPPPPPAVPRYQRRAMLRAIKNDLRRQRKRADRVLVKSGIDVKDVRLPVKSASPASLIRRVAPLVVPS